MSVHRQVLMTVRSDKWASDTVVKESLEHALEIGVPELPDEQAVIQVDGVRLDPVAVLMDRNGGPWGDHPDYSRDEWMHEVAQQYTSLGYWEWVLHEIEQAEDEAMINISGMSEQTPVV